MPSAGKHLKGRAQIKDKKAKGKDPLALEADQLRELELRRKRETLLKMRLTALQEEEQKMSDWSSREVQMRWRDLQRHEKLGELRSDIEILAQEHDKAVERKNAVIDMLFADLDEADEQYRLALRTHLQNIDTLLELHSQRTSSMEEEFEKDLAELKDEFSKEKQYIQSMHQEKTQEVLVVMQRIQREAALLEQELIAEFSQQKDETRDKNSEDYNVLKQGLELEILDLQNTIHKEHERYLQAADEKMKQYNELLKQDKTTAERIATQMRRIQRLTDNISNWKANLTNNTKECEERNKALRVEKDATSKHLESLKARMQRWRSIQQENLNLLVQDAEACKKALKAKAEKADRVLRLAELCAPFETERERVLTFHNDVTTEEICDEMKTRSGDLEAETMARTTLKSQAGATATSPDSFIETPTKPFNAGTTTGGPSSPGGTFSGTSTGKKPLPPGGKPLISLEGAADWDLMENFWRKYNKVVLDVTAIQQEKAHLQNENAKLRTLLKQYIDGVSITPEVMAARNNLLMATQMTGTERPDAATLTATRGKGPGLAPVVEASEVVVQAAKHHVPQKY